MSDPTCPAPRIGSLCTGYGGLDLAVELVLGAAHRCDRLFLLAAPADQLDAGHSAADAVRP